VGNARKALTREIGPLPVWAWLVVIVGGVLLGRMISRRSSGDGDEAEGGGGGSPSRIQLPAGYSGGAVGGGIMLPNGAAPEQNRTSETIESNEQWRRQAVAYLVGAGNPPLGVDRALFAYLNGQELTPEQSDYVSEAITRFGIPPSAPAAPTAESAQPPPPAEITQPTGPSNRGPTVAAPAPRRAPTDRAERIVFEAYDDVLGRAPDDAGLAYWAGQIRSGAVTPSRMRDMMADSIEFRGQISTGA